MITQRNIPGWQDRPEEETSYFTMNSYSHTQNIMIFTDSSRTNTDIGAAFCATKWNEVTHRRAC